LFKHAYSKSKIADGRHFGKIDKAPYMYLGNSSTIATKFGTLMHIDFVTLSPGKISDFYKSEMADGRQFENR